MLSGECRLGPCHHLSGRSAREGEQHDPVRRNTRSHQMSHPGGQRRSFSSTRTGENPQGRAAELNCLALFGIESFDLTEHLFEVSSRAEVTGRILICDTLTQ